MKRFAAAVLTLASIILSLQSAVFTPASPREIVAAYTSVCPDGKLIIRPSDAPDDSPVLGFTDSPADPADLPPQLAQWLTEIDAQIKTGAPVRPIRIADDAPIEPLTCTLWNQGEPFNRKTPILSGRQSPSGCVATAMAQVIAYHQWPRQATGAVDYTYSSATADYSVQADLAEIPLDYRSMLKRYQPGAYTDTQADAVASLMWACGAAAHSEYYPSETSSSIDDAAAALVNNFGYSRSMRIIHKSVYTMEQWTRLLYDELAAGRPVLFRGSNSSSGHAFVIDGYADGYFHVNWGWGGGSNGYFLINGLDPAYQGIGGSTAGYNDAQAAVIGITPAGPADSLIPLHPTTIIGCDWGPDAKTYSRTAKGYTPMQFIAPGRGGGWGLSALEDITLQPGVKYTPIEADGTPCGEPFYCWYGEPSLWQRSIIKVTFTLYTNPDYSYPGYCIDLPEGRYSASPAVRDTIGTIADAAVGLGCRAEVYLNVTEDAITVTHPATVTSRLTNSGAPDYRFLTPLYCGRNASFEADFKAINGEFSGYITPTIRKSFNGTISASLSSMFVSAAEGDSITIRWGGQLPSSLTPGDYVLQIDNSDGRMQGMYCRVTLNPAPEEETATSLTDVAVTNALSGSGTKTDPYLIDSTRLSLEFSLECTSGFFDRNIRVWVMEGESSGAYINYDKILHITSAPQHFLETGQSRRIAVTVSAEDAKVDQTYHLRIREFYTDSEGYTAEHDLVSPEMTNFRLQYSAETDTLPGLPDKPEPPTPVEYTIAAAISGQTQCGATATVDGLSEKIFPEINSGATLLLTIPEDSIPFYQFTGWYGPDGSFLTDLYEYVIPVVNQTTAGIYTARIDLRPNAIVTVEAIEPDHDTIYDLLGRRLNAPVRGLFIVNGRKQIFK